ncbi:MAG: hypothetical protein GX093_02880 [Xanthomonadaceae bacterium]|nr:hypothetical protein [Xanthomonadaceae bacterium]
MPGGPQSRINFFQQIAALAANSSRQNETGAWHGRRLTNAFFTEGMHNDADNTTSRAMPKAEIREILKAFGNFIFLSLFLLISPALVYLDSVVLGYGIREHSFTEYAQEIFLFVAAIAFFLLACRNKDFRGFAILVGGFFGAMLIREFDALFDRVWHGFWVYPAVAWSLGMVLLAARYRQSLLPAMASATRSHAFVFVMIGLATVLAYSRVFGTGSLWRAVIAEPDIARAVKDTVQEGLELMGYLLIVYGSIRFVGARLRSAQAPRIFAIDRKIALAGAVNCDVEAASDAAILRQRKTN